MSKKIIGYTGPSVFSGEVQAMIEQGLKAIPLFINQNDKDDVAFMANQCDGIVLSGGVDIFPPIYGNEVTNGDGLKKFDVARDRRELELIRLCFESDKPIMGICRGHQMLGIYQKAPIMANIGYSSVCHSPREIEVGGEPIHYVRILEKHREELGMVKVMVNSFHHQALWFSRESDKERNDYQIDVLAYANLNYDKDKSKVTRIIELMRGINNRWISCQWHPENDWNWNQPSAWVLAEFQKMVG